MNPTVDQEVSHFIPETEGASARQRSRRKDSPPTNRAKPHTIHSLEKQINDLAMQLEQLRTEYQNRVRLENAFQDSEQEHHRIGSDISQNFEPADKNAETIQNSNQSPAQDRTHSKATQNHKSPSRAQTEAPLTANYEYHPSHHSNISRNTRNNHTHNANTYRNSNQLSPDVYYSSLSSFLHPTREDLKHQHFIKTSELPSHRATNTIALLNAKYIKNYHHQRPASQ